MARSTFHRFELNGQRFAIDPETCFCFECDEISWDVLPFYPDSTVNRIFHELEGKYERKELNEVIGEFEWLRATKSIIAHKKQEDFFKDFEQEQGLRRLVIRLPRQTTEEQKKRGWFRGAEDAVIPGTALETGHHAINLLLNRAGDQPVLHLEFLEEGTVHNPELLARLCAHALKQARLAGKGLSAAVHVTGVDIKNAPDSLGDHAVAVKLEFQNPEDLAEHMKALSAPGPHTLARWVKVLQSDSEGVAGRIVVTPRHAGYGKVVETLHQAGFRTIELDLDGAYLANPGLSPRDMLQGLSESAVYYARCLAKQQYFRLDPIAPLFYRIYNGTPLRRADPAGMNELAVDEDGAVYPSWRALGRDEFKLGSLTAGSLDEGALGVYEGLGSQLISTCRRCWARNLCGGGTAAVHHALTGSVRTPQEAWCDAQRDWLAAAVSAFSHLSAHGVNFTRVYTVIDQKEGGNKPGMLTLLRLAFRLSISMRPVEESDAEMLTEWQNWSDATYFVGNESGIFLGTVYDREMDALHPMGLEHELVVTKKDGTPIGLFKIRPTKEKGAGVAWLYIHDARLYESDDVRKGFRTLLEQAHGLYGVRCVLMPAAERETGLQTFLNAVGFEKIGVQRDALYVHGAYHDIGLFRIVPA